MFLNNSDKSDFKFVLRKYKLTDITAENSGGSVLYTTKKTQHFKILETAINRTLTKRETVKMSFVRESSQIFRKKKIPRQDFICCRITFLNANVYIYDRKYKISS